MSDKRTDDGPKERPEAMVLVPDVKDPPESQRPQLAVGPNPELAGEDKGMVRAAVARAALPGRAALRRATGIYAPLPP